MARRDSADALAALLQQTVMLIVSATPSPHSRRSRRLCALIAPNGLCTSSPHQLGCGRRERPLLRAAPPSDHRQDLIRHICPVGRQACRSSVRLWGRLPVVSRGRL